MYKRCAYQEEKARQAVLAQKNVKKRFNIILDESTQEYIISAARERNISASELIRELINDLKQKQDQKVLREAAASLYGDYASNPDLTEFTSLDGEDYL
jgi:predicted HicB family RNase H-like nuclease